MVLAALVAAGCGGGDPGPAQEAGAPDDALMEFVRCMRGHGVQLGDPIVRGDSVEIPPARGVPVVSREEFEAAEAACRAEGHGGPAMAGSRAGVDTGVQDGAVAFARCVRRHGIDLPDPRFDDGTVTNWDVDRLGIDLSDPRVLAVGDRCSGETGFNPWEDL